VPELVLKLRQNAMDSSVSVVYLLREAKVVATKLALEEFPDWIELELNGYSSVEALPPYRRARLRIMFLNPSLGIWQPVRFEQRELQDAMSNQYIFEGIGVIEGYIATVRTQGGFMGRTLQHEYETFIRKQMPFSAQLQAHIDISVFEAIVDSVRNHILDWALSLEKQGTFGVDTALSENEIKSVAESGTHLHVQSMQVYGNVGNLSGDASVYAAQHLNVTATERHTLANTVTVIEQHLGNIPDEQREEVEGQLEILDEELKSPAPRKSRLLAALKSVGRAVSSMAGTAAKTAIEAAVKYAIGALAPGGS
jgi:hypothetical protein